jgi:hypothetical protein
MAEFRIQEWSFGASTVFRVIPETTVPLLVNQLTRRDRWVLLLLDGRRTLADLARLTHRSELDIAYTLAQFLRWGYIEWLDLAEGYARGTT